jgi:hypothetical protein
MIDENKIGVRVCWRLSGATPPNGYKGNKSYNKSNLQS